MSSDPEVLELGNYRVLRKDDGSLWMLGRGGYGTTYKAEHKHLGRICALKVINDDLMKNNDARRRFLKEAQAAALLDHAHIASIYDFGESDGVFYYAMSYCAGGDLSEFSVARGPQPWSVVRELGRQMLEALVTAHGKGLLHRDLKPSNIMLAGADGPPDLQLIDFGLVKMLEHHQSESTNMMLTQDGSFMGNPLTASPEQLREEDLDERSDLFSLGVTLWYLLCGESPFGGISTAELVHQRLGSESYDAALPDDLSVEGRAILGMLLSKNKKDRFSHAHEVLEALAGNFDDSGEGVVVSPAPASAPATPREIPDVVPACDWDQVWEIQEQLKKFSYGTYYSCVGKTHGVTGATLFIPDVESPYLDSVVRHADKMVKSGTHVLTSFFQKGEHTEAAAYLCQPFSKGHFKTFLHAVGNLDLQKHLSVFQQIASAVDESIRFDIPGVELDMSDILLDLRTDSGQAPQTEEDWIKFFTEKENSGEDYIKLLEVSTLPKLVRSADIEEAMVTVGSDDLAANPIARFGGFLYRAITGMSAKQTAYLSPEAHVQSSSISEESNRFLSEVISARECPESAMEMLKELCNFEAGDWRTSELEATLSSMDKKRHEISRTHSSMLSMIGTNPAHSVAATPPPQPVSAEPVSLSDLGKAPANPLPPQETASISTHTPLREAWKAPVAPKVSNENAKGGKKTVLIIASIAALLLLLLGGGLTWWFGFRSGDEAKTTSSDTTAEEVVLAPDAVSLSFPELVLASGAPASGENYTLTTKNGKQLGKLIISDGKLEIGNLPSDLFDSSTAWPLKLELVAEGFAMSHITMSPSDFEAKEEGRRQYGRALKLQPSAFIDLKPIVNYEGKEVTVSAAFLKRHLYSTDRMLDWKTYVKDTNLRVELPVGKSFPVKSLLTLPSMKQLNFTLEHGDPPTLLVELSQREVHFAGVGSFVSMTFKPDYSSVPESELKKRILELENSQNLTMTSADFMSASGKWLLPTVPGKVSVTSTAKIWSFALSGNSLYRVCTASDKSGNANSEHVDLIQKAERGDVDAQYQLGLAYIKKDAASSTAWFKIAAENNDKAAQHNLALAYERGTGVTADHYQSVKWYIKAAQQGYPDSQMALALCYQEGRGGLKRDYKQAEMLFLKASEQGNVSAMYNLAILYEDPKAKMIDKVKAVEWYKKAADLGHVGALYNLAWGYEKGEGGLVKDVSKAIELYRKAAEKGSAEAKKALQVLEGR